MTYQKKHCIDLIKASKLYTKLAKVCFSIFFFIGFFILFSDKKVNEITCIAIICLVFSFLYGLFFVIVSIHKEKECKKITKLFKELDKLSDQSLGF